VDLLGAVLLGMDSREDHSILKTEVFMNLFFSSWLLLRRKRYSKPIIRAVDGFP
jgi:hypothetical protein